MGEGTVFPCMDRSPRLLVVSALAATIVLWASAFVAIREALPSLGAGGTASGRLALAAVAFGVVAMVAGVRRPARAELPVLAAMGATGFAGYQLLLSAGERTVPAGTAALLLAIAPVVAAVLAGPVLGERLGAHAWAGPRSRWAAPRCRALAPRRAGRRHRRSAAGRRRRDVYALWIVLQKRALRTLSPLHLTAWGTWFGALFALPFGGGLPTSLGDATGGAVAALLVLGLVLSTVPFLLWAWVLQRMPASLAAPALLTIGPVGVLLGWALLGEQPSPLALLGGAITVAGVATVQARGPLRLPRLTGVREPAPQHA